MSEEKAKASVEFTRSGQLQVRDLDGAQRVARVYAANMPGVKWEELTLRIIKGRELGLSVGMSVETIAIIRGRPCVWGDGIGALIERHPRFSRMYKHYCIGSERLEFHLSSPEEMPDDYRCVVTIWVNDAEHGEHDPPVVDSFSVADAKQAGLWLSSPTWKSIPSTMLWRRALKRCGQAALPSAFAGLLLEDEVPRVPEYAVVTKGIAAIRMAQGERDGEQTSAADGDPGAEPLDESVPDGDAVR